MKALQKIEEDGTFYWTYVEVEEIQPAKPIPEIPPPCWDERPIDAQRCIEAMRALCGDSSRAHAFVKDGP